MAAIKKNMILTAIYVEFHLCVINQQTEIHKEINTPPLYIDKVWRRGLVVSEPDFNAGKPDSISVIGHHSQSYPFPRHGYDSNISYFFKIMLYLMTLEMEQRES